MFDRDRDRNRSRLESLPNPGNYDLTKIPENVRLVEDFVAWHEKNNTATSQVASDEPVNTENTESSKTTEVRPNPADYNISLPSGLGQLALDSLRYFENVAGVVIDMNTYRECRPDAVYMCIAGATRCILEGWRFPDIPNPKEAQVNRFERAVDCLRLGDMAHMFAYMDLDLDIGERYSRASVSYGTSCPESRLQFYLHFEELIADLKAGGY